MPSWYRSCGLSTTCIKHLEGKDTKEYFHSFPNDTHIWGTQTCPFNEGLHRTFFQLSYAILWLYSILYRLEELNLFLYFKISQISIEFWIPLFFPALGDKEILGISYTERVLEKQIQGSHPPSYNPHKIVFSHLCQPQCFTIYHPFCNSSQLKTKAPWTWETSFSIREPIFSGNEVISQFSGLYPLLHGDFS